MTYAVGACRTGAEMGLVSRLCQVGHDCYTPLYQHNGALKAAFPSYLFVNNGSILPAMADSKRWGVPFHVLMSGDHWGEVSEEVVDLLKETAERGGFTRDVDIEGGRYRIGNRVRVIAGKLFGREGIVLWVKGKWVGVAGREFLGSVKIPDSVLTNLDCSS